jgi:hypothetical protein
LVFQGTQSSTETVTFTVSHNRAKVKNVHLNPFIPSSCGSGGPPPVETTSPAKIKKGKFSAAVQEHTVSGAISFQATVTGKFRAGAKVTGAVDSTVPIAPQCNAQFTYTASRAG